MKKMLLRLSESEKDLKNELLSVRPVDEPRDPTRFFVSPFVWELVRPRELPNERNNRFLSAKPDAEASESLRVLVKPFV